MNRLNGWTAALVLVAACGTARAEVAPAAQPGTQAQPAAQAQPARDTVRPRYTAPDVKFMQHMIAHHAQALEMTRLVPERTTRQDIRLISERIEVSQRDEIGMMQRWLRARGQEVPEAGHAHGGTGHAGMPGMATPAEMARLAAARGDEFDRLFLQYMIRHHEGALVMVAELFASPGAGQEGEIFGLASEVEADQRSEIARMRTLPGAPAASPRRPSPGGPAQVPPQQRKL
ncbi:MAG TPA: DUF305 domain-containing protein [Longimicrobium sp.]|jgi:uncharacterized protein (DUF305 family)